MKRMWSLLCLVLVLLAMALPAGAAEAERCEDSVTIPEEVLACLDLENVDTVFCVYGFSTGQFSRYDYSDLVRYGDVASMLANVTEPKMCRRYFVKDKMGETAVYSFDGESLSLVSTQGGSWYEMETEQGARVIQTIDSGIVVKNIYYLVYPDWTAIYYKTNLGDYIYVLYQSEAYLMARKPFFALQEELYELSVKYAEWRNMDNEPYQVRFRNVKADLSPYLIESPNFNPHAPLKTNWAPGRLITIGSFVLLVALIIGRFLIRGHRKNREMKDWWASRI